MEYDPTQFRGTARFYRLGRAPYSASLGVVLARELGLDGTGHLLDIGAGPGTLGLSLVPLFDSVTLLEPDPEMVAEARSVAPPSVSVVQATAEALPTLGLPPMRVVAFAQSFHRTDRLAVLAAVWDLLEPGGALVLVTHDPSRPAPVLLDLPPVPREAIDALVRGYLGPERRSGARPVSAYSAERFEATLARSAFGPPRIVHAPGRADLVRDVDAVVAGVFSMSVTAPYRFGDRLADFEAELRALLANASPTGEFWEWPGDTELVIATRI